jgi:hypothetical protein
LIQPVRTHVASIPRAGVRIDNLTAPGRKAGYRVDAVSSSGAEPIPPELFLDGFPPGIRAAAARLRQVVSSAVPDALERVRTGWRLIGYDVPAGKRSRYFAFIAPEVEHVHLGFEYGIWMVDADNILRGAHLNLRKVRYVTYQPGDPIPEATLIAYTRDAAALAAMSGAERLARDLSPIAIP